MSTTLKYIKVYLISEIIIQVETDELGGPHSQKCLLVEVKCLDRIVSMFFITWGYIAVAQSVAYPNFVAVLKSGGTRIDP